MKKFGAILISILSIPFFTLGLLFLIAATTQASRGLVGLAFLAIATFLLVVGLRQLRRLAAIDPEVIKTGVVTLARRLGGELTVAQIRAEYRISQD